MKMSSTSEERSEESDSSAEEEDDVQAKPLYALAPIGTQEKSPKDVSASPAFQCLDELLASGKIPGTRVAELKAKYTLLYETLKSIQESEMQLLQDAKRFTNQLEQQQHELQKVDQFPESSNTEVSRMRQQLLKYNNDLHEAEDREYRLQFKLDWLQEEKTLLEREYERLPKIGELEKRTKLLKETSDELQKENTQRLLEIKELKEDMASKEREIQIAQKELEKDIEQQEIIKDELVQVQQIPVQLAKDIEKINRKSVETEKKKLKMEEECQELNNSVKQMENKSKKLLEEKEDVLKELEGKRTLLENKEQEFNHLTKLLEYSKENEAAALGERAALELNLRHAMIEKQNQHDALTRKQREKERDLRNIKKLELQFKSANDALAHTQALYDKIKTEIDNSPKDDGSLVEKRKELRKEVETLKRNFTHQQTLTELESHALMQCIAEEERLVKQQAECREELVNLTRLAQVKGDEREQKSRDFVKAQQRYTQVVQDIKGRDLLIGEHKKKNQEVQIRLKEFAKMYDIIRNERNKCVSLIQTATQRAAELREKLKIYGNEVEILRTNVSSKERQLQKAMLKQTNNHMIRDSLRKDKSKITVILQEMKEIREQKKMEIGRLTNMINQAEEDMVRLRKKYETAVQNRNERGVQLIEREEEVCIFYEKINAQEMILQNGDVSLMEQDEKIRFLTMKAVEKKRQIAQVKKELPNKRKLESDLVVLQIQLSQCNDRLNDLEKQAQDPEKASRIRLLEGKDPSQQELLKRTEELELRLAEKEEQLLERDFLYEQVSKLSDRIRIKAANGKEDTLTCAKKMSEQKNRIKDTTRKMMSQIAELSMQQANCIKLQQEIRDKETFVETCYARMEQGLPPSEEIKQEWKRLVREERRRQLEKEEKTRIQEEEEQHFLQNGTFTTAEQRPNAYIPEDENVLPIPRPYGALAPFKPTEPGSNMRHIRKPTITPIEI
ncbi:coiled-coil domain-containing protein 146 [Rana temporaria]|uniref:coiled-coil domain-containing protein 146 n=1 Tax=Rana temporaria TaxID=8407 RepID=UPI001AAD186B|nr:coiled-coil domain-containing protein 146 [Rana temporaria]XP_040199405.1 coiled-coil domain-containing protein 146 [Rana temporaria]